MQCPFGDQNLRIQLAPGGVIHCGAVHTVGPYTKYRMDPLTGKMADIKVDRYQEVRMTCKQQECSRGKLVDSSTPITCKHCLKKISLGEDAPVSPQRFVVLNTKTKKYFKNNSTRCSPWSDFITDAFLFKAKHTAEDKTLGWRYVYEDDQLTYGEWVKRGRPETHIHTRVKLPYLEVRPVRITIEE